MIEAEKFHNLYEKYAPEFGYETREDTKEFDPVSPNGKLMIKVVNEVVAQAVQEAQKDQLEKMKVKVLTEIRKEGIGTLTGSGQELVTISVDKLVRILDDLDNHLNGGKK